MSEAAPQGTPAPDPSPAPATPPPAAAAPTAPVAPPETEPGWLKERLERAEANAARALLSSLGVDDVEKAKSALAAAKASEEANKTAEQRAAETAAKLASALSETERLRAIATEHAARQMTGLTAEQQAAVQAIAGDDPASQLRTIGALAPTWAQSAAAAQAVAPPPANTAPPPNAPAPTSAGSPPDHKTVYSQLRASNPFEAAAYAEAHPSVYDATR